MHTGTKFTLLSGFFLATRLHFTSTGCCQRSQNRQTHDQGISASNIELRQAAAVPDYNKRQQTYEYKNTDPAIMG